MAHRRSTQSREFESVTVHLVSLVCSRGGVLCVASITWATMSSWCVKIHSGIGHESYGWPWAHIDAIQHMFCQANEEAASNAQSSVEMSASVNDKVLATAVQSMTLAVVVVVVASVALLLPIAARMMSISKWYPWNTRVQPEASRWLHEAGESREFAAGSIPYHLRGGRHAEDGGRSEYMFEYYARFIP